MPSSEYNNNNNFTQAKNIRDWIFARRIRYLGQLSDKTQRVDAVIPDAASTFYLPVTQTSGSMLSEPVWFAVYYNDENNQRDKIIATIDYDTTQMDLDVELHYACAHGKNNHPRLDGIRYCGPANGVQDVGLKSCTRQWYDPLNPGHAKNDNGRYTSCRADKGKQGAPWGEGIRLIGQLDCNKKPSDKSRTRDGWAFVRVQRRVSTNPAKNNPHVCTPLKISWQSDNTGPNADVPVECNWDP